MKRRELITGLAVTAITAPLGVRAQPARRLAVLLPSRDTDPEFQTRMRALMGALQHIGWTQGSNLSVDVQWAGSTVDRIQEIASSSGVAHAGRRSQRRFGRHSGDEARDLNDPGGVCHGQ